MRLITRRAIYRAFPELDRFDDERCARFVRAAGRGFWKRARGLAVMVGTGFLILVAVYGVEVGLAALAHRAGLESWPGWLIVVIGVSPVIAGVFGGAWTRDLHLRRRIRRVLRTRGVCTGCRYSLVGLTVGDDHRVVCPECGADTLVDPALGELAVDEDGRARFRPGDDPLGLGPRYWTAERVRRVKRVVRWILIAVPSTLFLLAASYETFLWWQAGIAKRERPTGGQIRAFMEGDAADAVSRGEDAWGVFFGLESERAAIAAATEVPEDESGIGSREAPDYDSLDAAEAPEIIRENPRAVARFERQRETVSRLMRAYEESGWFGRLETLRLASPRGRWGPPVSAGPALESATIQDWGNVRQWVSILRARMAEARRKGDVGRYMAAADTMLALGRMIDATPTMHARRFGLAIDTTVFRQLREVVEDPPDQSWLISIENVLSSRHRGPVVAERLKGEELLSLEGAAWLFEEPARVRGGRFSSTARRLSGNDLSEPLGTYASTRAGIERLYRELGEAAAEARLDAKRLETLRPRSLIDARYGIWLGPEIARERLAALDEAALRVMITLEWYRRFKGRYPDKLEDMGDTFIMPIDPWSGGPVRYVRLEPGKDESGRGYLLYSVGPDGVDDGGLKSRSPYSSPLANDEAGTDLILNDRDRR